MGVRSFISPGPGWTGSVGSFEGSFKKGYFSKAWQGREKPRGRMQNPGARGGTANKRCRLNRGGEQRVKCRGRELSFSTEGGSQTWRKHRRGSRRTSALSSLSARLPSPLGQTSPGPTEHEKPVLGSAGSACRAQSQAGVMAHTGGSPVGPALNSRAPQSCGGAQRLPEDQAQPRR